MIYSYFSLFLFNLNLKKKKKKIQETENNFGLRSSTGPPTGITFLCLPCQLREILKFKITIFETISQFLFFIIENGLAIILDSKTYEVTPIAVAEC